MTPRWNRGTWVASIAVAVGLTVIAADRPVEACRGEILCLEPRLVPSATAPANLPAIAFWPWRERYAPLPTGVVRFTRVVGGAREDVPFTTRTSAFGEPLLVPTGPLAPMSDYEVAGPTGCRADAPAAPLRFRTGPTTSLPVSLGAIGVSPVQRGSQQINIPGWGSECGPTFAVAFVDARLELPPEAEAWSGALIWTATMDGQPWSIQSVFGHTPTLSGFAPSRFYVQCDGPDSGRYDGGPRPGRHRIGYRAHLPGQDSELTVEREVEIRCEEGGAPRPDAGVMVATDLGQTTDQGAPTEGGAMLREGGLGCSAGGSATSRPGVPGVTLAALLGLVVTARRRREP